MPINSYPNLESLRAASTTDTVAFVSDPLSGGTFLYQGGAFKYSGIFIFAPSLISPLTGNDVHVIQSPVSGPIIDNTLLKTGCTVIVKGTQHNDGEYPVNGVAPKTNDHHGRITISSKIFTNEEIECEIIVKYSLYFNTNNTLSYTSSTVIQDSSQKFLEHGFVAGQLITVTDSDGSKLFTIGTVLKNSITISSKSFSKIDTSKTILKISLADEATIIDSESSGSGFWLREYDPANGYNVSWFGAKGDSETDDTAAIQSALDYAVANLESIKKVVLPPGRFLHDTLYVYTGILLTGSLAINESLDHASTWLVNIGNGNDGVRLIESTVDHTSYTTRLFWYGGVTNLSFYAPPGTPSGWAIACRNKMGEPITPQDMNFFENINIKNYNKGGLEFPDGAVPLNVRNIKGSSMKNGPIIYLGASVYGRHGEAVNLENVSADHSPGGAIWIDYFDEKTNILITNLKSEGGDSTASDNLPNCQQNAIICSDCDNTSIILDNCNHQNTSRDSRNYRGEITINIPPAQGDEYTISFNGTIGVSEYILFYSTGSLPSGIEPGTIYQRLESTDPFKIGLYNPNNPTPPPITRPGGTISQSGVHLLYTTTYKKSFLKPGDIISIESYVGVGSFGLGNILTVSPSAEGASRSFPGGRSLMSGDIVKLYSDTYLPGLIIPGHPYYVVSPGIPDPDSFKLANIPNGDPIDTSIGDQPLQFKLFKQLNAQNTSNTVPKINWRGAAARVRLSADASDLGQDPQVIAQSGIPFRVSEGKFNVMANTLRSKITLSPSDTAGASINIPKGNTPSTITDGDVWYDETGLKFKNGTGTSYLLTGYDSGERIYTETIDWTCTQQPGGTSNNSYQWTQIGKMVTVRFNLLYSSPGTAVSNCNIHFPSDLPLPFKPNGFTIGQTFYVGSAGTLTSATGGVGPTRCNMHSMGGSAYRLDVAFSSAAIIAVLATVTYWIA